MLKKTIDRILQFSGIGLLCYSIFLQIDNYLLFPYSLFLLILTIGLVGYTYYPNVFDDMDVDIYSILAALFMLLIIGARCWNINGHDFNVYSDNIKSGRLDFPFSWSLMRIFTTVLGNPNGLFILSFCTVVFMYIIYRFRIIEGKHRGILYIMFPFIFLGNQGLIYLSGGVLRNLIGFSVIVFAEYYYTLNSCEKVSPFILSLTHLPSLIYYTVYRLLHIYETKRFLKRLALPVALLLCGYFLLRGEVSQSIEKIFEMIIVKLSLYPFFYNIDFHGWYRYSLTVLSVIIFFIPYQNMKLVSANILMMVIALSGWFNWRIMLRFIFLSFFNIANIIVNVNDEDNILYKIFIILLAVESVGSRIP